MNEKEILGYCPICDGKMQATVLTCTKCETELSNRFNLSKYDYLSKEDMDFLEAFLISEGNLKEVQGNLGITYMVAKRKINQLLVALNFIDNKDERMNALKISELKKNQYSKKASDIIRNMMINEGGRITVNSQRGNVYDIEISEDGNSFLTDALPSDVIFEFSLFDIIVDLLFEGGGKASKGNGRNSRYGEGDCTEDTVVGRLARDFFGVEVGQYSRDPIMVINAMMTWAGITQFAIAEMQLTNYYQIYYNSNDKVEFQRPESEETINVEE